MQLIRFKSVYPEFGKNEGRSIIVQEGQPGAESLPHGTYHLLEYFCTDLECRCRDAVLPVYFEKQVVATLRHRLPEARDLRDGYVGDVILDPSREQGPHAEAVLALYERMIDQDRIFVTFLQTRGLLMRALVLHGPPFTRSRNERCPCKSGKKYKRCCLNPPVPGGGAASLMLS